jgi:FixJ family two-component response regulator
MVEERAVVFVIDDDPSMRLALEDLVSTVGLEVRTFAAPQEFLQSKPPDAPGCLVLDVRMSGMSGLTFQICSMQFTRRSSVIGKGAAMRCALPSCASASLLLPSASARS